MKQSEKTKQRELHNKYYNNQGYQLEIIEYNNVNNITIKFEDGIILNNIKLNAIKRGSVKHPNCPKGLTKDDINEIKTNKYGWEMKISKWNNKNDIDVEFLYDNSIATHKQYSNFKNGTLSHPKYSRIDFEEYINRINEIIRYPNGHTAQILEYRKSNDIDIIFDDGYTVKTSYYNFHSGSVMHPIEGKCETDIYDRISNHMYDAYKRNAESRNIQFSLTKEIFKKLIFSSCNYCGSNGNNNRKKIQHLGIKYNGIDRINPKIGYINSNVVTCCRDCNFAKNDLTYQEWINYLKRISKYYNINKDKIIDTINNVIGCEDDDEKK